MMYVRTKRLQQRVEQPIMVRKNSDSGHLVVINVSIESFAGLYRLTIGPLVWQSCHTPMCQYIYVYICIQFAHKYIYI